MTARHTADTITDDDLDQLYATLDRVRAALASFDGRGVIAIGHVNLDVPTAGEVLDAVRAALGPAATDATDADTTARVFAALHHSAEQDVTRVIDLYERWVKAGPPPLGVLLARWWDARLAELHAAIRPAADEPARTITKNPPTSNNTKEN